MERRRAGYVEGSDLKYPPKGRRLFGNPVRSPEFHGFPKEVSPLDRRAAAERRLWRMKRSESPVSKAAPAFTGWRSYCELWGSPRTDPPKPGTHIPPQNGPARRKPRRFACRKAAKPLCEVSGFACAFGAAGKPCKESLGGQGFSPPAYTPPSAKKAAGRPNPPMDFRRPVLHGGEVPDITKGLPGNPSKPAACTQVLTLCMRQSRQTAEPSEAASA